jgi:hypothetical protein
LRSARFSSGQVFFNLLKFRPDLVEWIKSAFTEREFVILASAVTQVNYWARLIRTLRIPPVGSGE